MAEGGVDPTDPTTEKTPLLTPGDDDDDDEWKDFDLKQVPGDDDDDRRNTFEPTASSTPAGSEHIPLKTMTRLPPEKQGASSETSFTTRFPTQDEVAKNELEHEFPNLSVLELKFRYRDAPRSGGSIIEVRYHNTDKWYPLYTKSRGEEQKTLNTGLPKQIQQALGKSTTQEINEANAALKTLEQQEKTQLIQLHQLDSRTKEAQRLRREMDALRNRMADNDAQRLELENEQGPIDPEAIQRLKDEKRELEDEHQTKRKELSALAEAVKTAQQEEEKLNEIRLRKGETERRLGELQARKDDIQPLDELKQKAEELDTKIKEDKALIADENTASSAREAAEARVAENEAELARVNEEIEARERQRPLLERVKDIFKKYGWTLQAVVLAVGLVLGSLALAGLNGLKAGTKAVGRGLKAIGQKLGSLLPWLIGSIVSYIFKAAGSVLSFLGEHAWLLILAVVAFFMERLLKRRRK